jgi:hypothetical protein
MLGYLSEWALYVYCKFDLFLLQYIERSIKLMALCNLFSVANFMVGCVSKPHSRKAKSTNRQHHK